MLGGPLIDINCEIPHVQPAFGKLAAVLVSRTDASDPDAVSVSGWFLCGVRKWAGVNVAGELLIADLRRPAYA